MYELVVIWSNGDKDVYTFNTESEAEQGARNMRKAFGNQISWSGVRPNRGGGDRPHDIS